MTPNKLSPFLLLNYQDRVNPIMQRLLCTGVFQHLMDRQLFLGRMQRARSERGAGRAVAGKEGQAPEWIMD